jgi:starch phosphorylase
MRASMSALTPRFSSNRMLREYVERLYLPAAELYAARQDTALNQRLCIWQDAIVQHWDRIRFGELRIIEADAAWQFSVPVYLDDLDADFIAVELFATSPDGSPDERRIMQRGDPLVGAVNSYTYSIGIPKTLSAGDFTPRIVPAFEGAMVPIEAPHILWYG